ncbi:MAG: LptF/LptG family permease [Bacteroidetes bacterium]|nr:LptF/LptG family permease [Bacteroidota bacterium]MDA0859471.1 LptF/LptG family permease [Bacteroidota bacterium]MDA1317942.1 LptF/LptG family permease [Bacteroidota bacterium]
MKILDRYILSTYLKSFFSVFTILMFIFLLQSVWVYISELAGKDLEFDVILKFLIYVSPRIVVLVLPLTVLLVSIMVFGNFSENYEFAAMKSTGISLQRAMKSLSIFIVFLSIVSFFFANNVIPLAEYNFYNLRQNIARVKPAMIVAEGQFNQIQDINIKVAKKSGDNGEFLEDVIIHQKKGNTSGNYTVIKSKTGEFYSDESSDLVQLILYDGNYYDEIQSANYQKRTKNRPQVKSTFERYVINIDVSKFNDVDFDKKNTNTRFNMLGVAELNTTIDSLYETKSKAIEEFSKNMMARSLQTNLNLNYNYKKKDSLAAVPKNIIDLFTKKKAVQLYDLAIGSAKSAQDDIKVKAKSLSISTTNINKHIVALHDKFALGLMCIILFFVGAPLGALIRKGGIGLPLVIAILIFLTYHFISIFAKNSSEDNSLDPVFATWLAGLIMLPFSIYLTSKATKDRALLDLDSFLIPLKQKLVKTSIISDNNHKNESVDTKNIDRFENDKLIDLVKNYRHYGLSIAHKKNALQVLEQRGITELELKLSGNLSNESFESGVRHMEDYHENATLANYAHLTLLIFGISGLILNNNGLPTIGKILVTIGIFSVLLFLVLFTKVLKNQSEFYKILKKNFITHNVVFVILALPLFFLYRLYFNKKMNEDLTKIS